MDHGRRWCGPEPDAEIVYRRAALLDDGAARAQHDMHNMTSWRCPCCARLLFKGALVRIQCKCPRCGTLTTFEERDTVATVRTAVIPLRGHERVARCSVAGQGVHRHQAEDEHQHDREDRSGAPEKGARGRTVHRISHISPLSLWFRNRIMRA